MAEYIKREAAIRAVNEKNSLTMTRDGLIKSINAIHSVAAEVVMYYKDCKYYDIQPDGRVMNWCNRRGFAMYDEDFCSRAEPKEDK